MIDIARLSIPEEDLMSAFPELGFSNRFALDTRGEAILVCDPISLADVYNSKDDVASFVREHGAFLMDFGGDTSCPVWWRAPFVLFPLSMHLPADLRQPPGTELWVDEIATDSGSFVYLPLTESLPPELSAMLPDLIESGEVARLPVPAGHWQLLYEQFEPPQDNMAGLYRNIVLKRTQAP